MKISSYLFYRPIITSFIMHFNIWFLHLSPTLRRFPIMFYIPKRRLNWKNMKEAEVTASVDVVNFSASTADMITDHRQCVT